MRVGLGWVEVSLDFRNPWYCTPRRCSKKTRLLDENLLQILLYPIIDYTGSIILDLI